MDASTFLLLVLRKCWKNSNRNKLRAYRSNKSTSQPFFHAKHSEKCYQTNNHLKNEHPKYEIRIILISVGSFLARSRYRVRISIRNSYNPLFLRNSRNVRRPYVRRPHNLICIRRCRRPKDVDVPTLSRTVRRRDDLCGSTRNAFPVCWTGTVTDMYV